LKKEFLLVISLIAVLVGFNGVYAANNFNLTGYVYDTNANAISNANVTVEVYLMGAQGPTLEHSKSNLSASNGSFSISQIDCGASDLCKIIVRHFNGSNADYVGQPLPLLPCQEIQNLGSVKFYLKEGVTLNITAKGDPSRLQNVTVASSWNLNTSVVANYASPNGLEWNDVTQNWAYVVQGNPTSLVIKNSDFTDNRTYQLNASNPVDLDLVGGFWYVLDFNQSANSSQVKRFIESGGSLIQNATYSLSQNYSDIFSIEEDDSIANDVFYVSGINTTGSSIIDVYEFNGTDFVYNKTYALDFAGKLERMNNQYWYIISPGNATETSWLTQYNNDFSQQVASWGTDFNAIGLELNPDSYLYVNVNDNTTKKLNLYDNGTKQFRYQIKDTKLGYPVAENFDNAVSQVTAYLPADRNYSIMIYPEQAFPVNYNLNNISSYTSSPKHIDIQFNTSEQWKTVQGFAKLNSSAGPYDNLTVIGFALEPGNMIAKDHPIPMNLGALRQNPVNDSFNATAGFYNITLPGAVMGANILLFAIAENNSNYYGDFKSITLNYNSPSVTNLNFTLQPLAGSASNLSVDYIESSGGSTQKNISVAEASFELHNSSGSNISQNAFVEVEVNYSGLDFAWMVSVSDSDNGNFKVPLLQHAVKRVNVYSPKFAPKKTAFTSSQLSTQPLVINLTNFDPGAIDPSQQNNTNIKIDLIKSNSQCDVPNYNRSLCSLIPQEISEGNFSPLSVVIGGGKISFVMIDTNNSITIHYKDVDLLASGPPDALFDPSANETNTTDTFSAAWRFGSYGPEIYEEVLIGIPYNDSKMSDSNSFSVLLKELYDDSWNVIWNTSNGTSNLPDDFSDFSSNWFSDSGVSCSKTDSSSSCYVDTSNNKIWITIPHFSGVGPEVSSQSSSSNEESSSSSTTTSTSTTTGSELTLTEDKGTFTLDVNDKVSFEINGEEHTMRVASVGDNYALLRFYSSVVEVKVYVGETKNVDLDADGVSDIAVTVEEIIDNSAKITIEKLGESAGETSEGAAENETAQPSETAPAQIQIPENAQTPILIGIVLVILGIVGWAYMHKKKRR